jgi:excisionase family DNA binding protein
LSKLTESPTRNAPKKPARASENKPTMSVNELADHLGISRQKAYDSLNSGAIPAIRLGKRFIISRIRIDDWLSGRVGVA